MVINGGRMRGASTLSLCDFLRSWDIEMPMSAFRKESRSYKKGVWYHQKRIFIL